MSMGVTQQLGCHHCTPYSYQLNTLQCPPPSWKGPLGFFFGSSHLCGMEMQVVFEELSELSSPGYNRNIEYTALSRKH